MTSAYNGRLYDAVNRKGLNAVTLWDGQVWDINLWAIPKGSDRIEEALAFLRFATDSQNLADQARYISYGPARQSSMAIINEEVKPFLPTAPENQENALQFDFQWWAEHQQEMDSRFQAWLATSKVTPIVGYE
jgi:putative spermidine/putrescine transport system substrate-binding protein